MVTHWLTAGGRALCAAVFGGPLFHKQGPTARPWWSKARSGVTCAACRVAADWCLERGVRVERARQGRFNGRSIAAHKAQEKVST